MLCLACQFADGSLSHALWSVAGQALKDLLADLLSARHSSLVKHWLTRFGAENISAGQVKGLKGRLLCWHKSLRCLVFSKEVLWFCFCSSL